MSYSFTTSGITDPEQLDFMQNLMTWIEVRDEARRRRQEAREKKEKDEKKSS